MTGSGRSYKSPARSMSLGRILLWSAPIWALLFYQLWLKITMKSAVFAALGVGAAAVNPLVDLGYSQYNGVNTGAVTQWLGIRYAAPPVGELRFKKPTDPIKTSGVQQADKVRPTYTPCLAPIATN